jgi:hypothetical protein
MIWWNGKLMHSQLFEGLKSESKYKITEGEGVEARSLAQNTLRGKGDVLELQDGTRKSWQASLIHTGMHATHTRWLVHSWSTFSAKMSHGQHEHIRLTTAQTWGKPPPSPL